MEKSFLQFPGNFKASSSTDEKSFFTIFLSSLPILEATKNQEFPRIPLGSQQSWADPEPKILPCSPPGQGITQLTPCSENPWALIELDLWMGGFKWGQCQTLCDLNTLSPHCQVSDLEPLQMPFAVPPPRSCRHPLLCPAVALEVYTAAVGNGGLGVGGAASPEPQSHSRVRGGHVWAHRGTGGHRAGIWNTGTFIFNGSPSPLHTRCWKWLWNASGWAEQASCP